MRWYHFSFILVLLIGTLNISMVQSSEPFSIEEYLVEITPMENEVAYEHVSISILAYEPYAEVNLEYVSILDDLEVVMPNQADSYTYLEQGNKSSLVLYLSEKGSHDIELYYITNEFSLVGDDKLIYSPTFVFPSAPGHFKCSLVLDEEMAISTPLMPAPTKVYSNGNTFIVEWEDISSAKSFYILCAIRKLSCDSYSFVWFVLIIPFLGIGYFLGIRRNGSKGTTHPNFKTDELKVWALLKEGALTHRELVDRTDFSKSKISRILKELEERGVVEQERYKNKNIIRIVGKEFNDDWSKGQ